MKTLRRALIRSTKKSDWLSVQVLSQQLEESYAPELEGTHHLLYIHEEDLDHSCQLIAQEGKGQGIEAFVLIDNRPFPSLYLPLLFNHCLKNEYFPEIHIHLYGCCRFWLSELVCHEELLKKFSLKFFAPSEAQHHFLVQVLPEENLQHLFFPFTSSLFSPVSREEKMSLRKKLNLDEKAIYLIYSGRFHIQKNIDLLLLTLENLKKQNQNYKLILCGSYDTSGIPMLYPKQDSFDIVGQIQTLIEVLKLEDSIIWKEDLNQKDLASFYQASDLFLSLSTYNDEDYGRAPLEALSSGLPAVLSSWGGYKEYGSPFCSLVPITRIENDLELDLESVSTLVNQLVNSPFSSSEISSFYKEHFSPVIFREKLKINSARSFKGFTSQAQTLLYEDFPFDHKGIAQEKYLEYYQGYYR